MAKKKVLKSVETITHEDASRKHIPTAECQSILRKEHQDPIRVAYERRNRDLDPQLVWRGKDEQDWSELVVQVPPLFIQDKVHPKVLIDDLTERTKKQEGIGAPRQMSLFDDFNGLPDENAKTEFYQHDANWSNRMILGDSLKVMASLAEREGLRGKVQCIYFDPPYGIKFNSNFQWSTTSRDVKDGKKEHITREPEQVKAFRDTWRDGIHTYLTYLRDRLTVARDLLNESGSLFVQIGDENVHRIRAVIDEVFGADNCLATIFVSKTSGFGVTRTLGNVGDYLLWYAKNSQTVKYRQLYVDKDEHSDLAKDYKYYYDFLTGESVSKKKAEKSKKGGNSKLATYSSTTSQGQTESGSYSFVHLGKEFKCPAGQHWKTTKEGFNRLARANRIFQRTNSLRYVRLLEDYGVSPINNLWSDLRWGYDASEKRYVVETNPQIVARCILMTTDPGDLVLDPTCGSGTTAYVSEQWGRRWITVDTSRVSLALARSRIMGARYPYYLLSDSPEGKELEVELFGAGQASRANQFDIRHGFVYERAPHIMLKDIANNAEIDVVWDKYISKIDMLLNSLNSMLETDWKEWQVPLEPDLNWPLAAQKEHTSFWKVREQRQKEIDASIAVKSEFEYLYDRPYEDAKRVRVAGPFTVESISPHRVLTVDENDELVDGITKSDQNAESQDFAQMILDNLKTAGVQQAHKEDKIVFSTLTPWPGHYVCAEGVYEESGAEKRAAIFIGPEFGTVSRPDLVAAAREAGDAGFDALIACAFNFDAHSSEFHSLGRIPVLKARMNADLHMADDLKNTGKGNLFVIFGEPDIDILEAENNQVQVKINGVDVFHPNTGEVRSDGAEGIACWFIDTDYNEESFFVRHAYFLGANDPYKSLKTTLKAEINKDSWDTLNSDLSRPFEKPESGRIAVKVINHLGDEVMKVYRVD